MPTQIETATTSRPWSCPFFYTFFPQLLRSGSVAPSFVRIALFPLLLGVSEAGAPEYYFDKKDVPAALLNSQRFEQFRYFKGLGGFADKDYRLLAKVLGRNMIAGVQMDSRQPEVREEFALWFDPKNAAARKTALSTPYPAVLNYFPDGVDQPGAYTQKTMAVEMRRYGETSCLRAIAEGTDGMTLSMRTLACGAVASSAPGSAPLKTDIFVVEAAKALKKNHQHRLRPWLRVALQRGVPAVQRRREQHADGIIH